jgi:hypothetical protein
VSENIIERLLLATSVRQESSDRDNGMNAKFFSQIGHRHGRARGQSLVEFTIVLPILLLIVAGTLEVGNVLTHYNRVQLAAREAARFGAAGGSDLLSIVQDASQQALEFDPSYMTVWAIRPTIAAPTPDPATWSWSDPDGIGEWGVTPDCLMGDDCALLPSLLTPEEVIQETGQAIPDPSRSRDEIDGTTFIVVVVRYETETILNLPFFTAPGQQSVDGGNDRIPVWAYEALVQEIDTETITQLLSGCSAYPLALNRLQFPDDVSQGDLIDVFLDYDKGTAPDDWNMGGFGITAWNISNYEPSWVTRSCSSDPPGSICTSAVSLRDDVGFDEYLLPDDPDPHPDTELHRDDWVLLNGSNLPNIQEDMNDFADEGRYLRVMVYTLMPEVDPGGMLDHAVFQNPGSNPRYVENPPGSGNWYWQYQIKDFAIVKVNSVSWSPSDEELDEVVFEFIRWDDSCGYEG